MQAAETLPKVYTPDQFEPAVTARWEAARAFHAEPAATTEEGKLPYCILIPPPNVTAALHLGHAFTTTLQDILIRYHRMRGFNTLWMPGTDHAGIATQTVVEKRLIQEGKRRTDFSRDEFIALVQAWKDEYEATITAQLKAMGCSCDWERQRFTMDPVCAKAVREAFFRLFREGLIYRGKRLVNWDPETQTALADDEVEMEEVHGRMYSLRYPLVHPSRNPGDPKDCQEVTWGELIRRGYPGAEAHPEDENAWLAVATTRPETYLGDTAVAVHPKDPRSPALRGLFVQLPLVGRVIPVIEDEYVVRPVAFGGDENDAKAAIATGFLKVTPAHDPNDWEIGRRHNLPVINVLGPDASISDRHGWEDVGDARMFVGLSREAARDKVVAWFKAHGLLEDVREYTHSVGHSYRSHVPIEPYLSDQWYVKVTDDRMAGEALRAMDDGQFEGRKPERLGGTGFQPVTGGTGFQLMTGGTGFQPVTGGTGFQPVQSEGHQSVAGESGPGFQPGQAQGASIPGPQVSNDLVKHRRNLPHWQLGGSTYFITFRIRQGELTDSERQEVINACQHWHNQRWHLHLMTVMPDHVHIIATPLRKDDNQWWSLHELMHSVKRFSAQRINEQRGRSGPLWQDEYFDRIIRDDEEFYEKWNYIHQNSVSAGLVESAEKYAFTFRPADDLGPDGRNTRTGWKPVPPDDAASPHPHDAGDGELTFFPARYARTFQSWHTPGNLRDWCISRQLWWGHRIPVWTIANKDLIEPGYLHVLELNHKAKYEIRVEGDDWETSVCFVAVAPDAPEIEQLLREAGAIQDPDVLDTWFSSGLWPLSTMGWPEPEAFPSEFPESARAGSPSHRQKPAHLLDVFNPSSVLCTAREIITLWVSRMVMFNRCLTANDPDSSRRHRLPFQHVYIHPVIQDGHGQKMSKSLGNGVDPRDIITTHGADALRFTLCQTAAATQDVRMPVDTICPHCAETFHPAEITTASGHRVAAPEQTCPKCRKKMVTVYGITSGKSKATPETPLALNTSSRFDFGRNFCNKLWNAVRFALTNLGAPAEPSPSGTGQGEGASESRAATIRTPSPPTPLPGGEGSLSLPDKWILARLHRTLHRIEDALAEYQFNVYAEAMYDFIWRDFCDWYLEAVKPTIRTSPLQQQVLQTVLNATLRLLHPISPFVTEALYPSVNACGFAGLPGLKLGASKLLATAPWPDISCSIDDKTAHDQFARVQTLVDSIRTLRGEHRVPDRKRIGLLASPRVLELIESAGGVVQALAGLESAEPLAAPPRTSVPFSFEGEQQAVLGLIEAVDPAVQRQRLGAEIEKLGKSVTALEGRLANRGYLEKAPPEKVRETQEQLEQARRDLELKKKELDQVAD